MSTPVPFLDDLDRLDHGRSCVILTGAPGAGKSTVSRLVAETLGRSAVLNGDQVNRLIVRGRVWALGEPADEAARQVRLGNANLCALAANFADAAFTPIIDRVDAPRLRRRRLGVRHLPPHPRRDRGQHRRLGGHSRAEPLLTSASRVTS